MSIGINKLFEDSELLADQGRLIPAVQLLEKARKLTNISDRRALATYNLGVIYCHMLGDGETGRREFLKTATEFDTHGYGHPQFKFLHANTLENAMLCALSFDEFEELADRLHALTPEVPILIELVPEVREARERGEPWSSRLFDLARRYYDRNDPKQDKGRYGQAKSTYHLLLGHRRELRLSQEDWCIAMHEYCVLAMRMVADCMTLRGGDNDAHSPEEFLPILTEALFLVDEYLLVLSGDDDVKKFRGDMEQIVINACQRWVSLNRRRFVMPKKTDYQVCQNCGTVFARRDVDGPEFATMWMDLHDFPVVCTKCGGEVIWQSSPRVEPKLNPGCLPTLLGLILLAVFVVTWL